MNLAFVPYNTCYFHYRQIFFSILEVSDMVTDKVSDIYIGITATITATITAKKKFTPTKQYQPSAFTDQLQIDNFPQIIPKETSLHIIIYRNS